MKNDATTTFLLFIFFSFCFLAFFIDPFYVVEMAVQCSNQRSNSSAITTQKYKAQNSRKILRVWPVVFVVVAEEENRAGSNIWLDESWNRCWIIMYCNTETDLTAPSHHTHTQRIATYHRHYHHHHWTQTRGKGKEKQQPKQPNNMNIRVYWAAYSGRWYTRRHHQRENNTQRVWERRTFSLSCWTGTTNSIFFMSFNVS